ncbi:hypothetical protein [uncultured Mediterranean phage uvMED]|nr:hypothetical protein [uncultured Mediterranean phage uvMED]
MPDTKQMRLGQALQNYLGILRQTFPSGNPYGQALEDFFLSGTERLANQMAMGNPRAVIDTRPNTPLVNPDVVEAAGLLPVATAVNVATNATPLATGLLAAKVASDGSKDLLEARRIGRAREMGFDVDNPVFHGTSAENIDAFDLGKVGTQTDQGFYGTGIYFEGEPGAASYYGKNVDQYFVRGKLLDLDNLDVSIDDDYLGSPKAFKAWAKKLDSAGLLDDTHKKGLETMQKLDKYVDENIEISRGLNDDGTEGFFARIIDPNLEPYTFEGKVEYPTIDSRTDARGNFPKTKEDAIRSAKNNFIRDQKYRENSPFKGLDDLAISASDYLRLIEGGAPAITEKAKKAGFDGIKIMGETVIFDPKNIRKPKAKFDIKKSDSDDLLSAMPQSLLDTNATV